MRRLKIAATIPSPTDGTSFYRGCEPINQLEKSHPVDITYLPGPARWSLLNKFDVLFLQRPATAEQMHMANEAKNSGLIIWVDWDDNMFDIPPDNPSSIFYNDPAVRQVIEQTLKLADFITVSTQGLREIFLHLNRNTFVVPNALPKWIYKRNKPDSEREKIVLWRGTNTHIKDLYVFKDPIIRLAKEYKDWKFIFYGYWPWFIGEEIQDNFETRFSPEITSFLSGMNQLKASIGIIPLDDSPFNRCKSNIALLEMGLCGTTCVVPNWREWRLPGTSAYTSVDGLYGSVKYLIENEDQRKRDAEQTYNAVVEHFQLERMNEKRWSLLKQAIYLVCPELIAQNPAFLPSEKELPQSPSDVLAELSRGLPQSSG